MPNPLLLRQSCWISITLTKYVYFTFLSWDCRQAKPASADSRVVLVLIANPDSAVFSRQRGYKLDRRDSWGKVKTHLRTTNKFLWRWIALCLAFEKFPSRPSEVVRHKVGSVVLSLLRIRCSGRSTWKLENEAASLSRLLPMQHFSQWYSGKMQ